MNGLADPTQRDSIVLGLDIGRKRVGMALYDPSLGAIEPLPAIERAGKRAEQEILNRIEQHAVSRIVVGVPLSADDQKTEQVKDIEAVVHRLCRRCQVPVVECDEFLSSEEAKELLGLTANPDREIRETGLVDTVAACVILQRHLRERGLQPALELGSLRRRIATLKRSGHGGPRSR